MVILDVRPWKTTELLIWRHPILLVMDQTVGIRIDEEGRCKLRGLGGRTTHWIFSVKGEV